MKKLLIVGLIILCVYILISAVVARQIFTRVADHIDISPDFISTEYEDIEFTTSDGLTLKGWLFNSDAERLIIFVPGILDNRTSQGYYGAAIAAEFISNDYAVMMFDVRARGESDGTTRLKDEKNDVIAAVNYANSRAFEEDRIGLLSYSTGTLSTLRALSEVNVGAVVMDISPLNFKETIASILAQEQPIFKFFTPGILVFSEIYYGESLDATPYTGKIKSKDTDFLIIHAKNDMSVSLTNSEKLSSDLPKSRLIVYPNGSHIESYKKNKEKYLEDVLPFFENALSAE